MKFTVAVVALVPLLAACGTATDTDAQPRTGSAEATSLIEARANSVFSRLTGNATQREAARFLQFTQMNAPFVDCMDAAGYKVDPEFLPIWRGYVPNATSGAWMGALGRKPSAMAEQNAVSARAELEAATNVEASDAYQDAAQRCHQDGVSLDLGNRPGVPAGVEELTAEFKKMIFAVDDELGSIGGYEECMSKARIPFNADANDGQGWQALYNYLVGQMPRPPIPGEEASAEWKDYLGMEAAAVDADSRCRGTRYLEGLQTLEPLLRDFESKHSSEIDRISLQWSHTVEEALAQGFKP